MSRHPLESKDGTRLWLLACLVLGCGDDGSAPTDASADAAVVLDGGLGLDFAPEAPVAPAEPMAEPAPPSAPVLTPCPPGWVEVPAGEDEVATCAPWPEAVDPSACAPDEAVFPGGGACERVGPPCPVDGWPAGVSSMALHVRAGAPGGGDGTRGSPHASIGAALATASAGDVVAIARGTYDEVVVAPQGVTLVGACTADTVLEPSDAMAPAAVHVTAPDVTLRQLRIRGATKGVFVEGVGASATLESLVVESTGSIGVGVAIGAVMGREVVVRDVGGDESGIVVEARGALDLDRVVVDGARLAGVLCADDTRTSLTDAVVRNVVSSAGGVGVGVVAQSGADMTLRRSVVEDVEQNGIVVNVTARADLSDVLVRRTRRDTGEGWGRALFALGGADVVVDRFTSMESVGVATLVGNGARLVATNLFARDIETNSAGAAGRGVVYQAGALGSLDRARIVRARDIGLNISRSIDIDVRDAAVIDTREETALGGKGVGVQVSMGSTASFERLLVERAAPVGMFVEGSTVTVRDATVRAIRASSIGDDVEGFRPAIMGLQSGADVNAERVHLSDGVLSGIAAATMGTRLVATDLVIEDLAARTDGLGRALHVLVGATVDLTRVRIERYAEAGALFGGPGAGGTMRDVTIVGATGTGLVGQGLIVQLGASLETERFRVERARLAGVLVIDEASFVGSDLAVMDTAEVPPGLVGRGIEVGLGATASITRASFAGNHEVSISTHGGVLDGTEVAVTSTLGRSCEDARCLGGAGFGAGSYEAGAVTLSRFLITGSELAGAQLSRGGEMDLSDGVIRGNPIGINVQDPGYDIDRLRRRVLYSDNGLNLDASELPVPEAI